MAKKSEKKETNVKVKVVDNPIDGILGIVKEHLGEEKFNKLWDEAKNAAADEYNEDRRKDELRDKLLESYDANERGYDDRILIKRGIINKNRSVTAYGVFVICDLMLRNKTFRDALIEEVEIADEE